MELNIAQLKSILPHLREFSVEFMQSSNHSSYKLLRSQYAQQIYDSLVTWAMIEDELGTKLLILDTRNPDAEPQPSTVTEGVKVLLCKLCNLVPSWELRQEFRGTDENDVQPLDAEQLDVLRKLWRG